MRKIKVTNSDAYTIVDDDVYEWASKLKWHLSAKGYVTRSKMVFDPVLGKKVQKAGRLHREILGEPKEIIDHINRDPLDNRRENLRIVTQSQNMMNVGLIKSNKSGFRGVHYQTNSGRYVAKVTCNNKPYFIGAFKDPVEAARAYNAKAKELHGEYAWLNPV